MKLASLCLKDDAVPATQQSRHMEILDMKDSSILSDSSEILLISIDKLMHVDLMHLSTIDEC